MAPHGLNETALVRVAGDDDRAVFAAFLPAGLGVEAALELKRALLALEGRHYVLNAAGPFVLAIFTTALGALTGFLWVNLGGSVRNIGEAQRDDQRR